MPLESGWTHSVILIKRALYKLFVLKLLLSIFYIVKFLFYHYIAEYHENKGKAGDSFKENHSKFEGCYLN